MTPPGSIKTHVTRIPRSPDANLSARRNPPPQYHSVVHITPEGRGEYQYAASIRTRHHAARRPPDRPVAAGAWKLGKWNGKPTHPRARWRPRGIISYRSRSIVGR